MANTKSSLKYFGTSTTEKGHYFWDVYSGEIGNSNLDFNKCSFNPEKVVKSSFPFGTVIYERINNCTIIGIAGSVTDSRPGSNSIFWANIEMPFDQLKTWIMNNKSTKQIIDLMPFEIKWLDNMPMTNKP